MKKNGNQKLTIEKLIDTYVKHWSNGGRPSDVAKDLGVCTATVYIRTKRLRDHGVPLPKMERRRFAGIKTEEVPYLRKCVANAVKKYGGTK